MGKQSSFYLYFEHFRRFYLRHRTIPSFAKCLEILGVGSKSVVHRFFQQMVDRGFLEKKQDGYYPTVKLASLPLFGSVSAGMPIDVHQAEADLVTIDDLVVKHAGSTVLLKVKGDSMEDAGLIEDDIIVVDTSLTPTIGHIVVAIIDGGYTVKFYMKDSKGLYYFQSANDKKNYPPIYPREQGSIFGVVTGSVRTMI